MARLFSQLDVPEPAKIALYRINEFLPKLYVHGVILDAQLPPSTELQAFSTALYQLEEAFVALAKHHGYEDE